MIYISLPDCRDPLMCPDCYGKGFWCYCKYDAWQRTPLSDLLIDIKWLRNNIVSQNFRLIKQYPTHLQKVANSNWSSVANSKGHLILTVPFTNIRAISGASILAYNIYSTLFVHYESLEVQTPIYMIITCK